MNINDHNEMYEKRAVAESAERTVCDNCPENVIFHLKDDTHEFSMGLSTLLECLIFAIQTGDLPKLPSSWLSDADFVCRTDYAEDERNCYFDNNFPRKRE